jgi:hypothetical protein
MTIAIALFTTVTASVFAIMHPLQGRFETTTDVADVEQRLRLAANALSVDLLAAGAGPQVGIQQRPLADYFAPLRPIRSGTASDELSIVYVRPTAVQTTLSAILPPGGDILRVADGPGCPIGADVCGIEAGMTLLIYDDIGNADTFAVVDVTATYALVRITSRPPNAPRPAYNEDAKVVEVEARRYGRRVSGSPPIDQLVRDDAPVADHVVGLTFEYFADPAPPLLTPQGVPTYGPAPPPLLVQTTAYPPGENCTFELDDDGESRLARLPFLGAVGALVKLTPGQLLDGPWCPDEGDSARWDADLLRIRKVGVTLRIEAAPASLRGPAGPLFTNGGTSRTGAWVPDQEVYWEIAPRNLNLKK